MKFILASKSPRRREILSSLGLKFDIITSEADESSPEKNPEKLVKQTKIYQTPVEMSLIL